MAFKPIKGDSARRFVDTKTGQIISRRQHDNLVLRGGQTAGQVQREKAGGVSRQQAKPSQPHAGAKPSQPTGKKTYAERNAESIANTGKTLYQRRIESAQAKGLTPAQARGHAKRPLLPPSRFKPGKASDKKIFTGKEGKRIRTGISHAVDDFQAEYGDDYDDSIYVSFDADLDVDGYDLGHRTIYAQFNGRDARNFLANPTITSVIDRYASGGGGFSSAAWANGTSNISDISIHPA